MDKLTVFEVLQTIKDGEIYDNTKSIYALTEIRKEGEVIKFKMDSECDEINFNLHSTQYFTKRRQAYTFSEIMNDDCKRVRVISDYLNYDHEICTDDGYLEKAWENLRAGQFVSKTRMIQAIAWMCDQREMKEVFNNGKWYKEEV